MNKWYTIKIHSSHIYVRNVTFKKISKSDSRLLILKFFSVSFLSFFFLLFCVIKWKIFAKNEIVLKQSEKQRQRFFYLSIHIFSFCVNFYIKRWTINRGNAFEIKLTEQAFRLKNFPLLLHRQSATNFFFRLITSKLTWFKWNSLEGTVLQKTSVIACLQVKTIKFKY